MKNIINKLNKNKSFFEDYLLRAIDYYAELEDRDTLSAISGYEYPPIKNYEELIKYANYFWVEECNQKLIKMFPHITFDKSKITFFSIDELNKQLKTNYGFCFSEMIHSDSDSGGKFIRSDDCQRISTKNNMIPWCLTDKRPVCCCDCSDCISLPINVRCWMDLFFQQYDKCYFYDDFLQDELSKLDLKFGENFYRMEGDGQINK